MGGPDPPAAPAIPPLAKATLVVSGTLSAGIMLVSLHRLIRHHVHASQRARMQRYRAVLFGIRNASRRRHLQEINNAHRRHMTMIQRLRKARLDAIRRKSVTTEVLEV
jgi:hypothetical protein